MDLWVCAWLCLSNSNSGLERAGSVPHRFPIVLGLFLLCVSCHHLRDSQPSGIKADIDCFAFSLAANASSPRFSSTRAGGQEAKQTVLYPNLFLLGALKAASTFLWKCIVAGKREMMMAMAMAMSPTTMTTTSFIAL